MLPNIIKKRKWVRKKPAVFLYVYKNMRTQHSISYKNCLYSHRSELTVAGNSIKSNSINK
jgi:hypothetical protein